MSVCVIDLDFVLEKKNIDRLECCAWRRYRRLFSVFLHLFCPINWIFFYFCYVGKRMPSQCGSIDRFKIHEIVSLQKNTSIIPKILIRNGFYKTPSTLSVEKVSISFRWRDRFSMWANQTQSCMFDSVSFTISLHSIHVFFFRPFSVESNEKYNFILNCVFKKINCEKDKKIQQLIFFYFVQLNLVSSLYCFALLSSPILLLLLCSEVTPFQWIRELCKSTWLD